MRSSSPASGCLRASLRRRTGATPVADAAGVLRALPAELVERFERSGWLLIRNYNYNYNYNYALGRLLAADPFQSSGVRR
jgi:hypothetical protein